MTGESKRMSFSQMCAALPEGFSWGDSLTPDVFQHIEAAILQAATRDTPSDTERLDFLDSKNKPFQMGWKVGIAPAGNVAVGSVIQLGQEPTPIRKAIDKAIAASEPKGDGND